MRNKAQSSTALPSHRNAAQSVKGSSSRRSRKLTMEPSDMNPWGGAPNITPPVEPEHTKMKENHKVVLACALLVAVLLIQDVVKADEYNPLLYRTERRTVLAPPLYAPTVATSTPTKTSIYWVFADDPNNKTESGYTIHDKDGNTVATTAPIFKENGTYLEEKGLKEGTEYCGRHVNAFNTAGEGPASKDFDCVTTYDSIAPVVSNVKASSTSETSEAITWDTDELAGQLVYYWKDAAGYLTATSSADNAKTHSIELKNLTKNTPYSYLVSSSDAGGNEGRGDTKGFVSGDTGVATTVVAKDTTPPTLSDVAVKDAKATSAAITWNANEVTDGVVEYGESQDALGSKAYSQAVGTSHTVQLQGLKSGTTYYYMIRSKDASGNETKSDVKNLKTSVAAAPKFLKSGVNKVNNKDVTLVWETDVVTQAAILYIKEGTSKTEQVKYQKSGKQHSVKIDNLSSGTKYQIALYALDPSNNLTSRTILTFKTKGKKGK